jgi:hypothetical protein
MEPETITFPDGQVAKRGWKVYEFLNKDLSKELYPIACTAKVPDITKDGWHVPPVGCGPLAVFEKYKDAVLFKERLVGCSLVIRKVWYIESKQECQWVSSSNWWAREKDIKGRHILLLKPKDMPEGKVLADAVYVIEEEE